MSMVDATCNPTRLVCMVDSAMQVQIDQAASCDRCYTCRCVEHERCVCV